MVRFGGGDGSYLSEVGEGERRMSFCKSEVRGVPQNKRMRVGLRPQVWRASSSVGKMGTGFGGERIQVAAPRPGTLPVRRMLCCSPSGTFDYNITRYLVIHNNFYPFFPGFSFCPAHCSAPAPSAAAAAALRALAGARAWVCRWCCRCSCSARTQRPRAAATQPFRPRRRCGPAGTSSSCGGGCCSSVGTVPCGCEGPARRSKDWRWERAQLHLGSGVPVV